MFTSKLKGIISQVLANKPVRFVLFLKVVSYYLQNYWNLGLECKQPQLSGPVDYRDFRETGPWVVFEVRFRDLNPYQYTEHS